MVDSLDELEQQIGLVFSASKDLSSCEKILQAYSGEDWRLSICFSEEGYSRSCLRKTIDFEILLICWQGRQQSTIHDHPKNGCLQKVLQGKLTEERFSAQDLKLIKAITLEPGAVSYINNMQAFHKITNATDKPAISLHVYSPPDYSPKAVELG